MLETLITKERLLISAFFLMPGQRLQKKEEPGPFFIEEVHTPFPSAENMLSPVSYAEECADHMKQDGDRHKAKRTRIEQTDTHLGTGMRCSPHYPGEIGSFI